MEPPDVREHYEELEAEYDEHWIYCPDYIRLRGSNGMANS